MTKLTTRPYKVFTVINILFLILVSLICILPIIHIIAISLSASIAAGAGKVFLWPVGFNVEAYVYALGRIEFVHSFFLSIERVFLGVIINMFLTIICAFPLSKEKEEFPTRNIYAWFFFITILFNGGLIPWYMVVKTMGLRDSIWGLVIPSAVPVFSVILLLNFFRQLPKELGESASIDGASQWRILWQLYVPLSKPALATLVLFSFIGHWNSWFDALVLMSNPAKYPLQTYLQSLLVVRDFNMIVNATQDQLEKLALISDRTTKASQIVIGALPVLLVYPFLQKYFVKGIVLGSVKG